MTMKIIFATFALLASAFASSPNPYRTASYKVAHLAAAKSKVAKEVVALKDNPPPYYEDAKMARYITHEANWAALATIAAREPIIGYPFANIFSLSDGPVDNSTGVPYFYISEWEISAQDMVVNNQVSITMTLAQGEYCESNNLDPESPLCAHLIMTGELVKLTPGSEEEAFAKNALFSRHPAMNGWPTDHGWFFAKIEIKQIQLLAFFGGAVTVDLGEYYEIQL